ncbi:hypothetical protein GWI33_004515 [Rhynchophorus ferrugineus]|uniref:Uncharacterized protein n=1 Tax=Rhynchophorus ferrugineus TaxID=354439 RepID=A0A834MKD9_RHYFE|nr:hypothetical protein GWI33_004515 [Rhynchophorus ferrugineus]
MCDRADRCANTLNPIDTQELGRAIHPFCLLLPYTIKHPPVWDPVSFCDEIKELYKSVTELRYAKPTLLKRGFSTQFFVRSWCLFSSEDTKRNFLDRL